MSGFRISMGILLAIRVATAIISITMFASASAAEVGCKELLEHGQRVTIHHERWRYFRTDPGSPRPGEYAVADPWLNKYGRLTGSNGSIQLAFIREAAQPNDFYASSVDYYITESMTAVVVAPPAVNDWAVVENYVISLENVHAEWLGRSNGDPAETWFVGSGLQYDIPITIDVSLVAQYDDSWPNMFVNRIANPEFHLGTFQVGGAAANDAWQTTLSPLALDWLKGHFQHGHEVVIGIRGDFEGLPGLLVGMEETLGDFYHDPPQKPYGSWVIHGSVYHAWSDPNALGGSQGYELTITQPNAGDTWEYGVQRPIVVQVTKEAESLPDVPISVKILDEKGYGHQYQALPPAYEIQHVPERIGELTVIAEAYSPQNGICAKDTVTVTSASLASITLTRPTEGQSVGALEPIGFSVDAAPDDNAAAVRVRYVVAGPHGSVTATVDEEPYDMSFEFAQLGQFSITATLLQDETEVASDVVNVEVLGDGLADGLDGLPADQGGIDDCRVPVIGRFTPLASYVDNVQFSHHHLADDYQVQAPTGCEPCGGASPIYALPQFQLERRHRYKDFDLVGSFGPGVFSQFDHRLYLYRANTGADVIEYWDPQGQFSIDLQHQSGGAYLDVARSSLRGIQLYADAGLLQEAADQDTASHALLTRHDGSSLVFQLIDPAPEDSTFTAARLIAVRDQEGNAISLAYDHPADADETALGGDFQRLWTVDTITDAYGAEADLSYERHEGQWVLASMTAPNQQVTTYRYGQGDLIGLDGVDHPDGSSSSFTATVEVESGLLALSFDDPGASGTHRRKQVFLSQAVWNGQDQPANRVRKVTNADGELVYRNWLDKDPANLDHTRLYVETGGRALMRYVTDEAGNPVRTERATAWNAEADPSTYSWELVASYATDGQMRVTGADQPQGLERDYERDPLSGAITRTTVRDAATGTVLGVERAAYNAVQQPTIEVDRQGRVTVNTYDPARPWLLTSQQRGLRWIDGDGDDQADPGEHNDPATAPTGDEATWTWSYRADGQVAWIEDANGNRSDFGYTADGLLASVTEAPDHAGGPRAVTIFAYDPVSRLLSSVTDPVQRRINYHYDSRNRIERIVYSDESYELFRYGSGAGDGLGLDNDANLLVETRDRNGNRSEYRYDDTGRLVLSQIIAHAGQALAEPDDVRTWTYVPGTELVDVMTANGEVVDTDYDLRQRTIAVTRYPQGHAGSALTERIAYDGFGRVASREDAYGHRSFMVYDLENRIQRVVQEVRPGAITDASPQALATLLRDTATDPGYQITDTSYLPVPATTAQTSHERHRVADPRGVVSSFAYDWQGRIAAVVAAAATLQAGSNDLAAALAVTDPKLQGRSEYDYDAQGNRIVVRHPRYFDPADSQGFQQSRDRYSYTGRNRIAAHTRPATDADPAVTESWTYHLDGREYEHTDFRGAVRSTIYKACCGRLGVQAGPAVPDPDNPGQTYRSVRLTNFDFQGNLTHEAEVKWTQATLPTCCNPNPPNAQTLSETTTRYDHRHRPVAQTRWLQPLGEVDENAPPIATDPAQGLTTTWEYDDDLETIDLSLPSYPVTLGDLQVGTYADGSAVAIRNPANEVTVTLRDGLGRIVRSYDAEGVVVQTIGYDEILTAGELDDQGVALPAGLVVTSRTDAVAGVARSYRDGAGRQRYARDQLGHYTVFGYDAGGQRVRVRDSNGVGHDSQFDALGRETSRSDTASDTIGRSYDANGNLLSTTDGRGQQSTAVYDSRDRQRQFTDRLAGLTRFTHDANDNLLSITDAEDGITRYVYDPRNLLISERFPGHDDSGSWNDPTWDRRDFGFDPVGRLASRRDQTGALTTYAYDLLGRLTDRRYPDELDDEYAYDAAGRLTAATSARYATRVERSYHSDGMVDEERLLYGGTSYVVDHAYDAANRLTTLTHPNAVDHWDLDYTVRHQLEHLRWNGAVDPSVAFGYDPGRRETSRAFVNGITTSTGYYADNQISTIAAAGVLDFSYAYDDNKRKTSETDGIRPDLSQGFGYDDEDRLVSWTRTGPGAPPSLGQSWELSLVGDWTSTTVDGVTQDRDHNRVHELTAIDGSPLSYDPKGNLGVDQDGQTYTWDADNRLAAAANLDQDAGASANYAYDALGRRVAKTVVKEASSSTTVFVHDGPRVVCEYVDGVLSKTYGYGAYVDDVVLVVDHAQDDDPLYFYHSNHLYSVAAVTDDSGAVVQRYGYDAYGSAETVYDDATDTLEQPYRFTGRHLDAETGLMYFRARYYSAEMGRFIGRDPLRYVDGMSMYSGYFAPGAMDPNGMYEIVEDSDGNEYRVDADPLNPDGPRRVTPWREVDNRALPYTPRNPIEAAYVRWKMDGYPKNSADKRTVFQFLDHIHEHGLMDVRQAVYLLENPQAGEQLLAAAEAMMGAMDATGGRLGVAKSGSAGKSLSCPDVSADTGGASQELKRVGRWMSPEEKDKLLRTRRVQQGGGGQTRVSDPADPKAYRNAPAGDTYVEFDVPADRVRPHSRGTGRIPGPDSPDARLHQRRGGDPGDFEMPPAVNIEEK